MVTLKRIGMGSALRVGFFFSLITTVVQLSFWLFRIIVLEGVPISVIPAEFWSELAINILINCAVTGVGIGIFAFIYNNFGIGGLQLEFEMHNTPNEKRKNDTSDIEEID